MRKMKHCLMMVAALLCSFTSMMGETLPVTLTESDGLLATVSTNSSGTEQYEYTSPVYTLKEATNALYFTFIKGHSTITSSLYDTTGYPFVALAEFYLYDGEGNEIPLTSNNFSTNAQETTEGAISNICDGDCTTYWHSKWSGDGVGDYHRLIVTLPEGDVLSDFQFKYVTRYTRQCVPSHIQVGVTPEVASYEVSGTCGDNLTWTLNSEGDLIFEGTGPMQDFGSYTDVPWLGYGGISNVVIPEGVTSIGGAAFYGCSSLTSITIPKSVTSIGDNAFDVCRGLTSITIPEGVTSIGNCAFYGCSSLTSISIPASVTSIGTKAFYGCGGELIVNCNIPSASSYSSGAFYCGQFTKVTIGEDVTNIGDYAFYNCSSLASITIPEGVTGIGNSAFSGCSGLAAIIVQADVPPTIYSTTFSSTSVPIYVPESSVDAYQSAEYWSNFTNIQTTATLIDGIWYNIISKGSIAEVANIPGWYVNSVSIPSSVTYEEVEYKVTIGNGAFKNCKKLVSVSLPKDITSIGNETFYGCSSLASITIPEGVTGIGNSAFSGCSSLASITIPEGVTGIGNFAFSGCSSLTSITIPEGVTSIGERAFYVCRSLTSITIPEGVTSIGERVFYGCSSLTSITFFEGVTSIGYRVLYGCSSLTDITLPESLTSIGIQTFANCSSLTSITIPEGVTSIGDNAFEECSSLTSITISEGSKLTSIGNSAFYGCSNLTDINIPSSVTSIGNSTFSGCSSLTSITLPESVTRIYSQAFYGCSKLTTIVLQSSKLSSMGTGAFANCPELLDVYCNAETVPTAETDAFDGSYPEYATLHVPASAIESYKATAPWSSFGTIVSLTDELVTGITLSQTTVTMVEGATLTLTATIVPIYATNPSLTWSSSDEDVATVVDGKVTAVAPGTATITATANDGSGVSASCTVTVEEATYVKITINQYGSGTYCSSKALDFSAVEGLKAYVAAGYNTGTGVVTLMRVNTAKAGTGLFIKGEPGAYMVPIISSSLDNSLNMLVGTLGSTAVNSTSSDGLYYNYRYTIKDGDEAPLFYRVDDGYTLGTGKAYLQIPVAWLPVEAKSIRYRFDDGETADMEEIEGLELPSGVIYDLMGRRVTTPQRGSLYLINGKKTIY